MTKDEIQAVYKGHYYAYKDMTEGKISPSEYKKLDAKYRIIKAKIQFLKDAESKQEGEWAENYELVYACNSKGYIVKLFGEGLPNKFGQTHNVLIEGGQYRITFVTNALHGRNYFKIVNVQDYLKGRNYKSERYFTKFIPLISEINGETFLALKGDE